MHPLLPMVFSLLVSATVAFACISFTLCGAFDGLSRVIGSRARRRREQQL